MSAVTNSFQRCFALVAGALFLSGFPSSADQWMPPEGPTATVASVYSLNDLGQRLSSGTNPIPAALLVPTNAPVGSGATLAELLALAPPVHATPALPGSVANGQTYWGLDAAAWGLQTGALASAALAPGTPEVAAGLYGNVAWPVAEPDLHSSNIPSGIVLFGVTGAIPAGALSSASTLMSAGLYAGTTLAQVEPDLVASNIRAGAVLFGIAGTLSSAVAQALSPDRVEMDEGYYEAVNLATVDPDLVSSNLPQGVVVFGVTGSIPAAALSASSPAISGGIYASGRLSSVDADFAATNLRGGVECFGLAGSALPTSSILTALKSTGQTNSYYAGDDGALRRGMTLGSNRFTVFTGASSNCVRDNLTGLMWMRTPSTTSNFWGTCVSACEGLGGATNGLGGYDDWRMPNITELLSLSDLSQPPPTLPLGHPFHLPTDRVYWSSTTVASPTNNAWCRNSLHGWTDGKQKWTAASKSYYWPVRGP